MLIHYFAFVLTSFSVLLLPCHCLHHTFSLLAAVVFWIVFPTATFNPPGHCFLTLLHPSLVALRWAVCSETQVQSHQRGAGPRSQRYDFNVNGHSFLPVPVCLHPHDCQVQPCKWSLITLYHRGGFLQSLKILLVLNFNATKWVS